VTSGRLFVPVLALWLAACATAEPQAPPPALPPDTDTALVPEPVFRGSVYLLQAGLQNTRTVVLVHGLGERGLEDWDYLIPELAKQYHVIAFDLPGFGRSSKANTLYSPARYAQFIGWVIDSYARQRVSLVGHSMGGGAALYFAGRYPGRLERLILLDVAGVLQRTVLLRHFAELRPTWPGSQLLRPVTAGLNAAARALLGALDMESTPEDIQELLQSPRQRRQYLDGDPSRIAGLALIATDFTPLLPRIDTPTLILWGGDDRIAPLRTGKALAFTLDQARLEVIPGIGHVPMQEAPHDTNGLILEALARPPQKPARRSAAARERVGRCLGRNRVTFKGYYQFISIRGCKRVRLVDVDTRAIRIDGSHVLIRNSVIDGNRLALTVLGSHLHMEDTVIRAEDVAVNSVASQLSFTGARLQARTALQLTGSKIDFAGVTLAGKLEAVRGTGESQARFSISRLIGAGGEEHLHGLRTLSYDQPL